MILLPYLTLFVIALVGVVAAYISDRHRFNHYAERLDGTPISWPEFAEMLDATGQRDEIDDAPSPTLTLSVGLFFLATFGLMLAFVYFLDGPPLRPGQREAEAFAFSPEAAEAIMLGLVALGLLIGVALGFWMRACAVSGVIPILLGLLFFGLFIWFTSGWMPKNSIIASAAAAAFLAETIAMFPATVLAMWP